MDSAKSRLRRRPRFGMDWLEKRYLLTGGGYPAAADVPNVVTDFGAIGNGIADDTAAIQAAITAEVRSGNNIVYLPAGTYLVSNTLNWIDSSGLWDSDLRLVGAGQGLTTIKLANDLPSFGNPASPKAVIQTAAEYDGQATGPGGQGNGAFNNFISDMTIDVGSENPGAVGIDYLGNNCSSISDVTIQSSDPQGLGVAGISCDRNYPGPCLISDVTIHGFSIGLDFSNFEYSVTADNLNLSGQSLEGINVANGTLSVEGLVSNNSVPAIVNSGWGDVTVLDSTLSGGSTGPAIQNNGYMYAARVTTAGYSSAIVDPAQTIAAGYVSSYSTDPASALNSTYTPSLVPSEPPSISLSDPSTWAVIPWSSGDSTAAIQAAIDSGATTIAFQSVPHGANSGVYHVSGTIHVRDNVTTILGLDSVILADPTVFGNGASLQSVFSIETNHPVEIDDLTLGNWQSPVPGAIWFSQNTTSPLVIRDVFESDAAYGYIGSALLPGTLYIEDDTMDPMRIAQGQDVWARQLDIEESGTPKIINAGHLWALGYKTEQSGTELSTLAGGISEIYGGFFYPLTVSASSTSPAITAAPGSSQFLSFVQEADSSQDLWSTLVSEQEANGSDRTLMIQSVEARGYGCVVTSYGSTDPLTTPTVSVPDFVDPGFEAVALGSGFSAYRYDPTGSPWTFTGQAGLSGNRSAFTSGNPAAPQGTQVAFLQEKGQISQSVAGFAAGAYQISFDAAQRANYGAKDEDFEVLVDGVVVGKFLPTGSSYQVLTTSTFTLTAGSHTITFVGLDSAGGDNTVFLDATAIGLAPGVLGDPGFEAVAQGSGYSAYSYDPTGSPWTFTGQAGLSGNNSAFTSGNPAAPQGTQVAFLQDQGQISQSVAGFAAGAYQISFDAAQRANNGAKDEDFEVLVDGVVIGKFLPTGSSYQAFTTSTFTLTAGSHTITFVGLDSAGGDNTVFLDATAIGPAPPVIGDPDFESLEQDSGNSAYRYDPTGSPWTFTGGAGVSGNNSAFTSGNPAAPQGTQVAFLQEKGQISQSVAGFAAGAYQISFDAAQRANYGAKDEDFEVLVDGVVVGKFLPTGSSYQVLTTSTFTLTAGSHTITFVGLDSAGGDNTVFLDDVNLATA